MSLQYEYKEIDVSLLDRKLWYMKRKARWILEIHLLLNNVVLIRVITIESIIKTSN